jgi:hypothetical protein
VASHASTSSEGHLPWFIAPRFSGLTTSSGRSCHLTLVGCGARAATPVKSVLALVVDSVVIVAVEEVVVPART